MSHDKASLNLMREAAKEGIIKTADAIEIPDDQLETESRDTLESQQLKVPKESIRLMSESTSVVADPASADEREPYFDSELTNVKESHAEAADTRLEDQVYNNQPQQMILLQLIHQLEVIRKQIDALLLTNHKPNNP